MNRKNAEIVRVASVFVMQSQAEPYLKGLLEALIPAYQTTPGLSALKVLRRSLVGYEEISMVTTWESEERMRGFREPLPMSSPNSALIQREPPHVYQLIFDSSRAQKPEL